MRVEFRVSCFRDGCQAVPPEQYAADEAGRLCRLMMFTESRPDRGIELVIDISAQWWCMLQPAQTIGYSVKRIQVHTTLAIDHVTPLDLSLPAHHEQVQDLRSAAACYCCSETCAAEAYAEGRLMRKTDCSRCQTHASQKMAFEAMT